MNTQGIWHMDDGEMMKDLERPPSTCRQLGGASQSFFCSYHPLVEALSEHCMIESGEREEYAISSELIVKVGEKENDENKLIRPKEWLGICEMFLIGNDVEKQKISYYYSQLTITYIFSKGQVKPPICIVEFI